MWMKLPTVHEDAYLKAAILFTGDADLYGKYMMKAIMEWPYGCEHNLTCVAMNRQAYIGHAAACIAIGSPEYITRLAWHQLTQDQQDRANKKADLAIKIWEENYAKNKNWNRCIDGGPTSNFMDVRHIRENLPFFQRGEGFNGNASLGGGRGKEKKKDVRPTFDRFGGAIQTNDGSCERLF